MKKVLVTGANGFLASNVIEELNKRNFEIRAMLRTNADKTSLEGLKYELFLGEICQKADVFKAVENMDFVIHVAANTSHIRSDYRSILKANYLATSFILEACIFYNIKKLIFVSTANTIAYGSKQNPGTELNEVSPLFYRSMYARSKFLAERMIINAAKSNKLNALIVNPTFMLGPKDSKPSSGKIIKMYRGKKFVFITKGGKNFIHVKDAANAVCNAIEQGRSGERYLLGNENLTYKEFIDILAKIENREKRVFILPEFLIRFIGFWGNILNFTGIKSGVNGLNMKLISVGNYYSFEKAIKELSLPQSPVYHAISDAIEWFECHRK